MVKEEKSNFFSINYIIKGIKLLLVFFLVFTPIIGYLGISLLIQTNILVNEAPYVHWNGLDPHNQIYISWETSNTQGSYIKYGINSSNLNNTIVNSTQGNMHHLILTGLIPNTKYFYQVGSSETQINSDIQSFSTAPDTTIPFNFTLTSDTQQLWGTGHYNIIADAISNPNHGDTSFLINAGDLAQEPDDQETWNFFMNENAKFTNRIPIVPVLGNHDIKNDEFSGCNNLYTKYFNMSSGNCKGYYTFNWSNTQFVVAEIADTADEDVNLEYNNIHDQWLNQTLEAGQGLDHRILIFHRHLYSSIGNSERNIQRLMPIIEKYNVSLVFYGHQHQYERFLVDKHTIICLGGGGGLQNTYTREQEYTQIMIMGATFTRIFIDGTTVVVRTLTPTFDIVDEITLKKSDSNLILEGQNL